MSAEIYALLSYAARYWFCALMLLIVFRAWRATVVDSRRARQLRAWTGETGCIGEFIINPGGKRRTSIPIPREGVLGSSRGADICIHHRDVRRLHAHIEQREGGLLLTPIGRAPVALGENITGEALFARDGDIICIGALRLLLVLFDAPAETESNDIDEADELFFPDERPASAAPSEYDEFFDEDVLWRDQNK